MKYWIWLSKIPGIGIKTRRNLLEYFHTPEKIYAAGIEALLQVNGVGIQKAELIYNTKSLNLAEKILEDCEKHKIKIMTLRDDGYPDDAKQIVDMPTHLFYKGTVIPDSIGTAIVGARRCTRAGKQEAIQLATDLARREVPVISGMAKGIDSYAHTACLKAGGYTVAVLGNGLDICYPPEHRLLMQRIEEQGLLLSEYEPGVSPQKSHFPQRNRIIAAWSKEVVVVEARRGSGALITAEIAGRYGRVVTM